MRDGRGGVGQPQQTAAKAYKGGVSLMGEPYYFHLKTTDIDEVIAMKKRGLGKSGRVQQFVDSEVLKRCQDYVPMDSGELIRSGIRCTVVGSGRVKYDTPYARRWYYRSARFNGAPKRGNYWFERMKQEGGKAAILRGACAIAGGKAR